MIVFPQLWNITNTVPEFAVNASFGLTMTTDPHSRITLVSCHDVLRASYMLELQLLESLQMNNLGIYFQACGPTIPKDCPSLTMYKGVCLQLGYNNPLPLFLEGKYFKLF